MESLTDHGAAGMASAGWASPEFLKALSRVTAGTALIIIAGWLVFHTTTRQETNQEQHTQAIQSLTKAVDAMADYIRMHEMQATERDKQAEAARAESIRVSKHTCRAIWAGQDWQEAMRCDDPSALVHERKRR